MDFDTYESLKLYKMLKEQECLLFKFISTLATEATDKMIRLETKQGNIVLHIDEGTIYMPKCSEVNEWEIINDDVKTCHKELPVRAKIDDRMKIGFIN